MKLKNLIYPKHMHMYVRPASERMRDASCVLKCISTEGISEPASVPGIETTERLKPPTSFQAESTTITSDDNNVEDNYGSNNGQQLLVYPCLGKKQAQVEAQDLKRLGNDQFLNDNLIGCYIRFLEDHLDRTNKEAANQIFFFNTYFYTILTDCHNEGRVNFKRVQNWTKRVDIFSHDYIVVPINESKHWYAAIICNLPNLQGVSKMAPGLNDMTVPRNKAKPYNDHPTAKVQDPVIVTFDSLNMNRSRTVRKLRQYLAEEAKSKKGIGINTDLIAGLKAESLPMQSNLSDCGLYLLVYIEKFAQDPDQFISRLLRKEINVQSDWPSLTSSHLRLRLHKFLDDLRDEQEQISDGKMGDNCTMADRRPVSFLLGEPKL